MYNNASSRPPDLEKWASLYSVGERLHAAWAFFFAFQYMNTVDKAEGTDSDLMSNNRTGINTH